jgi:hypothetical protein
VRRRFLAGLLLAAWLSAGGPAWAGLQPGSYEMTTTVTMPGMPEPQSVTETQCIKPEDARDPGGYMLQEMSASGQCTLGDHSQEGDHLMADFICNMQGHRSNGHLDVTFAAAGMDGSIVMQVETGPQGAQHVTTTIKAVRRGDCS